MAEPDQPLIVELAQWFDTPPGQRVRRWEQRQVDRIVENVFGYHAFQIGMPQWDLLAANRILHKGCAHVCTEGHAAAGHVALVAHPEQLPFAAQSIDLLVLPHVLECSAAPHDILREAERVLVAEGRLVLTGFNPWSLWGARQRLPGLEPLMPTPAHLQISLTRLKDWFKLLSLDIDRGRFGCYTPLCLTDKWLQRWSFMEAAGDRWWPVCGAVYVVSAVKRVVGATLVGPAWGRRQRQAAPREAVVARNALNKSSGKRARRIGMGCKAQTAAIADAMARICNAADRPSPPMHATRGLVQSIPRNVLNPYRGEQEPK